jgi:hypothetical protein
MSLQICILGKLEGIDISNSAMAKKGEAFLNILGSRQQNGLFTIIHQ